MARYTGPKCKISKRLNISLKENNKNLTKKNKFFYKKKKTEYALQLEEKQKLKFIYGLQEKQFMNLFIKAKKKKNNTFGINFIILLEQRLDNIVYRLGFANTRAQARQLVNHKHILINNKIINIPSYNVKINEIISIKKNNSKIISLIKKTLKTISNTLSFITIDKNKLEGYLNNFPNRNEVCQEINESLIVEFYNKIL